MKNPNLPNREIRHAKLLTQAGFKIDMRWHANKAPGNNGNNSVNQLIYWINDANELLMIFDYEKLSLKRFLKKYRAVVEHNFRKRATVSFSDGAE